MFNSYVSLPEGYLTDFSWICDFVYMKGITCGNLDVAIWGLSMGR